MPDLLKAMWRAGYGADFLAALRSCKIERADGPIALGAPPGMSSIDAAWIEREVHLQLGVRCEVGELTDPDMTQPNARHFTSGQADR